MSSRNGLWLGILLSCGGAIGAFVGVFLKIKRDLERIETISMPQPADVNVPLVSTLAWGIPGAAVLLAGIVCIVLHIAKTREKSSTEREKRGDQ